MPALRVLAVALVTVALLLSLAPAASAGAGPKPWTIRNVYSAVAGDNYIAIYTAKANALATGRLLLRAGTWRDVRRLFSSSFALDVRYNLMTPKRLGRVILRAARSGPFVVFRSENGGYPFAPFAPETSAVRP
jgi:hypothetical protein